MSGKDVSLVYPAAVEDRERADERIPVLLGIPAAVRFLSCEPLLGPVDLRRWIDPPARQYTTGTVLNPWPRSRLGWVIAGGESGPGHRPMDPDWVRQIRDHCLDAGVSFFFKQWGGPTPTSGGRVLDGFQWSQFPDECRAIEPTAAPSPRRPQLALF